ncbi:hypothetical protein EMIT074MI3_11810 [Bacillus licheniformis]|jgi:hypothetical protein
MKALNFQSCLSRYINIFVDSMNRARLDDNMNKRTTRGGLLIDTCERYHDKGNIILYGS